MISNTLFISVDESTDIFTHFPHWMIYCIINFDLENFEMGNFKKGPPDAVRYILSIFLIVFPLRAYKMKNAQSLLV